VEILTVREREIRSMLSYGWHIEMANPSGKDLSGADALVGISNVAP
jgi:hypothetical protein